MLASAPPMSSYSATGVLRKGSSCRLSWDLLPPKCWDYGSMPPHPAYCFDSTENKVLDLLIYKLGKAKEGRKAVVRGAGIPQWPFFGS